MIIIRSCEVFSRAVVHKDCVLEQALFRIEKGLRYNKDGTVTVNLWKDLNYEDN